MTPEKAIEIINKLLRLQHFYPGSDEYKALELACQCLNREYLQITTE